MQRDYKLGAIAGFLTGLCLIPTAWNIKEIAGINLQNSGLMLVLPFISMIGIVFGVWLGKVLGRMVPVIAQISKFAAVGFLNTAINFAVLNIFSLATGIAAGLSVGEYNIPATAIAATNSYFWNKYWVFSGISRGSSSDPSQICLCYHHWATGSKRSALFCHKFCVAWKYCRWSMAKHCQRPGDTGWHLCRLSRIQVYSFRPRNWKIIDQENRN
jgi:putative flippase GtrA